MTGLIETCCDNGVTLSRAAPVWIVVLIAAGVPWAAGRELPPHRAVSLKLLSYNVHGGADASATAVANFIASQGPDIVSLQEVHAASYRDTVARIAGLAHTSSIHLGKTLLSRTPIEAEEPIPLVFSRSLLRISTAVDGIPISVYGVHISWDAEGDAQARQIVGTFLPRDPNPRKILIGDFNDEHYSTQNTILESALSDAWSDLGVRPGERTSWPATGWSGSEGNQLIDLLLYDPAGGLFPLAGDVMNLSPVLSDHKPVVFTVELTDPIVVAPPASFQVDSVFDAATLEVRFDREVDVVPAADREHYRISRPSGRAGPAVLEATVGSDRRRVRLRTEDHARGEEYLLAVEGIPARAGSIPLDLAPVPYRHLENLVQNPGAEAGVGGWEVAGGMSAYSELRQVRPYRGAAFFGGGAVEARSRAVQVVSLEPFSATVDEGRTSLILGAYLSTGYLSFAGGESRAEPYDDAELRAEVLDAAGRALLEASSGKYDTLYWSPYREELLLPAQSRSLRLTLAADRKLLLGGPQNDAVLEEVYAAVSVRDSSYGALSANLLANPGAEGVTLEPWDAAGPLARLANYTPLSGTIAVAASGDGLFFARSSRDGARLSQTVALPRFGRLDYLRWGGTLRTFSGRSSASLRVELLDDAGGVLLSATTGPRREAEWFRYETVTLVPESASRLRFSFEAAGNDIGTFGDALFAQVGSGPPGGGWFARGDVDHNGRLSLADAVGVLLRLFPAAEPREICDDAADVDDDGKLSPADALRLLNYLFLGQEGPPLPSLAAPGPDPTADALDCG